MKLLILTPGVFPDTYSGIGKHVFYLARQLQRLGNKVIIVTRRFRPEHLPYEELTGGIPCYRVPHPRRDGFFHPLWPIATAIYSRIWQKKIMQIHKDIDAVLTLNPWWTIFADPRRCWPRAKLIYLFHFDPYTELVSNRGDSWKIRALGRLYNGITKKFMKRADKIYVCSQHTKDIALSMLGNDYRDKLMTVPCAVDLDVYTFADHKEKDILKMDMKIPPDRPIFITVRGLKRRTGVDKLVRAAYLLKKDKVSFFLILVGKGSRKRDIENQIAELGLGKDIRMVSNLSEKELATYYRASDVFILPSQAAEGFGIATIEALASGLLVFGTDIGATPEILNLYRHNWIIHGCKEEDIYKKMLDFCHNPTEFAMPCQKIREITKENFSWPVVAKKFLEELQRPAQS